jgi:hypothetical protein
MTQTYLRPSGTQPAVQFICGAEREVFKKQSSQGSVKKTLRQRAQLHHGPVYVCVSKAPDDQLHTVLSTKYGYALGECVLAHLHQQQMATDNVIWCEALGDVAQGSTTQGNTTQGNATKTDVTEGCLLVIIVNGAVAYDAHIPVGSLDKNAGLILAQASVTFNIMVYGDTPIKPSEDQDLEIDSELEPESELGLGLGLGLEIEQQSDPESDHLHINAAQVATFQTLDQALLPQLKALHRFELVAIAKAFDQAKLSRWWAPWLVLAMLLVSAYGLTVFMQPKATNKAPSAAVVIDSFSGYKAIMQSPSPPIQISQVQRYVNSLRYLEGVVLQQSRLSNDYLTVSLLPVADVIVSLTEQLEKLGWKTSMQQGAIVVSRSLNTPKRGEPTGVMPIRHMLKSLRDSAFVAGVQISTNAIQSNGRYQYTQVTLSYSSRSDLMHDFIGIMLRDLPAVLAGMTSNHSSINTQENTVSFVVYGVANV